MDRKRLGRRGIKELCVALPLALAAAASTTPRIAHACGGTFCDAGPTGMPVDQTGENILFVLDDDAVETHIQIQYDPDTTAENRPRFQARTLPPMRRNRAFTLDCSVPRAAPDRQAPAVPSTRPPG